MSALIHAATMVTAGVFLMVRINPMLAVSADWVPTMIAWIGVITALFAATIAVAQNDIKKVLAYSTVSQLGYMFLAVGSGAYVAAIFHMVTHAFFKALLFLGSGSVIHGMHDEQDMRRMGLLRKFMPITAATFIVGWLAIAGVPPFAGFWSKDEILLFALDKSPALYVVGLVTALLTAYYMTRQVVMVFFGEARWEDRADEHGAHGDFKPHESPLDHARSRSSCSPGCRSSAASSSCRRHVDPRPDPTPRALARPGGRVRRGGHRRHVGRRQQDPPAWSSPPSSPSPASSPPSSCTSATGSRPVEPDVLANAWYYDQAVTDFMGGPGREAFEDVAWFDANVVDGAVNGAGHVGARAPPASCARARAASCAATPASSASASSPCSPGSSSCEGCCDVSLRPHAPWAWSPICRWAPANR